MLNQSDLPIQSYQLQIDAAPPRLDVHALPHSCSEGVGIGRIDVGGRGERLHVGTLGDEQQRRTLATAYQLAQRVQMARATAGRGVGELRESVAFPRDALDLDEQARSRFVHEDEIEPGAIPDPRFTLRPPEAPGESETAGVQPLARQPVGIAAVDRDQDRPLLDQFQRPGKLAVGRRVVRQPDGRTGHGEPGQPAGIGAVRRDRPPVRQLDIGEKALIALQQDAPVQGLGQSQDRHPDGDGERGKRRMNAQREPATAAVIVIGNEILSGRTVDANLPYLARELNAIGIRLREGRFVPDEEDRIVDAVNSCRARYAYVFTTGGIGPTHDDITAAAVARAFGVPLVRHPEAERRLRAYYPPERLNEARLKMAQTPEGAELIDNPVSIAPGFRVDNVYVLAGIPKVAQAMFESIRHRLVGGPPIVTRTLIVFAPEGEVAAPLAAIQQRFPQVEIGSYPFFRLDRPGTSIVLRGTDGHAVDEALAALRAAATAAGVETSDDLAPAATGGS